MYTGSYAELPFAFHLIFYGLYLVVDEVYNSVQRLFNARYSLDGFNVLLGFFLAVLLEHDNIFFNRVMAYFALSLGY